MTHTGFSMPLSLSRARKDSQGKNKPRLGERLIAEGVITRDQLEGALKQQSTGQKLGEILVDLGLLAESDLLPYLADQFGVPHVLLREGLVDPLVATLIPRHLAESCEVLALFKVHDLLTVAMAEPTNLATIDRVERATGLRVRPVLALHHSIEELIARVYGDGFQVDSITADMEQDAVAVGDEAVQIDFESLGADSDSSPIINLVNYILLQSIRQRASDIHIEAGTQHSTVRFRVDGMLREIIRPKKEYHPAMISRLKVMAKMDIAEHRLPQDGRIHVVIDQRPIDLRISTLPTVLGEKAVLRILDRSSVTFRLADLGIPERQMKAMDELIHRPNGLFLVTGPTGSGKTTTLYSVIELLKSVETNIITVEDPVEYRLDLINQVHVSHAAQMTFARALRAILRQDPDIIMIGEIRDLETAEIAVQAALTGHLVLSTLHTNDSPGAIPRLTDMGVAPFKIAAALVGVIAQRLTRRICQHCKTTYYPNPTVLDAIRYTGDRNRQFMRGSGCDKCYDTGYKGRVGIYELLEVTRELRDLIARNAPIEELRKAAVANGFRTLGEQAVELVEQGATSLDEILRVAVFE
ncbi:MAG: Flp pilus assembly complex ATPase component TadA [Planctomycetaceae bacterium]|nr:Flp pilus assembly complex ATPase component TadA [Planctomycetaceae bacterium]